MFDDENFDDGIDDEKLARGVHLHLWKQLFGFTKPYRRELFLLVFFGICTAFIDTAFPLVTRAVVDDVARLGADANLIAYGGFYFLLTVLLTLAVGGFILMAGKLRTSMAHDIRTAGFANLQRLSFSYYDYRPAGWIMARMTSDCERLTNILAWGILDLFWATTTMLAVATAMLVMNLKLGLIVLSVLPVLWWMSVFFQRRILKSAREVRRTNSRITGTYNEGIMGVTTSKAFVREEANLADFRQLSTRMFTWSVRNQVLSALYLPLVLTLGSIATGLALAAGGMDMVAGAITAGTLIAFLTYSRHFFEPVQILAMWLAEMQMAQASAERVVSLINARPEIADSDAVRAAIEAAPEATADVAEDGLPARIREIELRNVDFAYDPQEPVLSDINLTIRAGETVAIVGSTGGGKSTLVSLICRFYEPTGGQILIDGTDYRERSLHWLQSNLGMVLQTSHVFSGTIRDNIRYGRLDASDAEVEAAAKLAGAHDFIEDFERGYEAEVGEGGSRLSAGEKQLISFARAILADPQILIMDEATSSVDTVTEQRIQRGLGNVLAGRIALVIAHRLSTIRSADRILVLEHGRIIEQGSHEELLEHDGRYRELYVQQSLNASTKNEDWQGASAS